MFKTSQLSEEQKQWIRQWADEGATMADIQRKMDEEFHIRVTYIDTRFLILDLGITLKQPAKEEPAKEEPVPAADASAGFHVSKDEITIPGTLFSGKVVFSDGEKALWYVARSRHPGLPACRGRHHCVPGGVEKIIALNCAAAAGLWQSFSSRKGRISIDNSLHPVANYA